jgi:hypothetical protein
MAEEAETRRKRGRAAATVAAVGKVSPVVAAAQTDAGASNKGALRRPAQPGSRASGAAILT